MRNELTEQNTRTPLEQQLGDYLRRHPEGECLDFDRFLELVRKGRRARDYHRLMRHIVACQACRLAYLQLRAIEEAQRPTLFAYFRSPFVWVPAASVATAALALVWWLFQPGKTHVAHQPPVVSPPAGQVATRPPAPKPPTVEPKLAPERPHMEPPAAASAERPSPEQSPEQRELASLKRIEPFVREAARAFALLPAVGVRAGEKTRPAPPIRFLQPDIESNAAIPSTRPIFEWRPVQNAVGYRLQIRAIESDQEWLSVELDASQTRFSVPAEQALQPGAEYEVVLSALIEGDKRLTVRRRFLVLSAEQLHAWRWAREHAEQAPLLSAMVFYHQLDRYTDALACLQRARQKYPQDRRIQAWLKAVQQRIEQRQEEFTADLP
ncbi:MAG: hypothetical protein QXI60_03590 [Thermofilaceae archaeon]